MNRGKRFAKKTFIYAIGNFGSKVLTFLLVPYYTHKIPKNEYGIYDVMLVTISLLMPLVTLQTQEAIIAGMIDEETDNDKLIKSTLLIVLINSGLFFGLFIIINNFFNIKYGYYFIGLLAVKSIFTIVHQYARGLSKTTLYTSVGIIYTFVFLILNIVQLSVLHSGIKGLFISEIIASVIAICIVVIKIPEIIKALVIPLKKREIRKVVLFSIPLIPNNISWWMINASDRYVINIFLGSAANGIYAISYKFANVIQVVTSLIYLAWQEISLEEYNSKDKDQFYSKFFDSYMKLLMCFVLIAICCTKVVTVVFLNREYLNAWKYVAWLYMGTVYGALAAFLNTCYLATGKTREILKGTLLAGLINLIIDIALVNWIGIYAASLSTVVSSFVLLIRRIIDNKKYYKLTIDWKSLIILSFVCVLYSIIILSTNRYIIDLILLIPAILFLLIINKSLIKIMFNKIVRRKINV